MIIAEINSMAAKRGFAVLEVFLSCCAVPLFDDVFSCLFCFSLENIDVVIISLRTRQGWREVHLLCSVSCLID